MYSAFREDIKYYFTDFVRKGGEGGTPQIRNRFFDLKTGVFGAKKTQISALFEDKFPANVRIGGRGGTP